MYRIGYDAKRLFNNFTGLGNYSRTLVRDLAAYYPDNAYFLFTPKVTRHGETQFFLNSPLFSVQQPRAAFHPLWRTLGVKRELRRFHIDLYHGLSHELPIGIDRMNIAKVVTIHDLIFKHYPQQYGWLDRQIYDLKFRYACRRADRIIAISESTKQDIIDLYRIPPEKITVIYQSCHERFVQERSQKTIDAVLKRYHLPSNYLFYLGALIERKNLLGIVQALAMLPPAERLPLVIVGEGAAYKQQVIATARQLGVHDLLLFIQPTFDDLPALYQQSDIFIYPSYYEGFGIPIIEAAFSETPIITSRTSSLPEAAGPDAYLVDPARPEEIAQGIQTILGDEALRLRMTEASYDYAQRFRGEVVTEQVMDLYEELL